MVVKVYGSVKSACSQRVLACFLEKEVDFEIAHIDLQAGEQKLPDFLALQVYNTYTYTYTHIYFKLKHIKYKGKVINEASP